jgi:hypothetical protein
MLLPFHNFWRRTAEECIKKYSAYGFLSTPKSNVVVGALYELDAKKATVFQKKF